MIKVNVGNGVIFQFVDREAAERGKARWLRNAEEWEKDSDEQKWCLLVASRIEKALKS